MSAPEVLEDEEAALARVLGGDTVATPAALNAGLRWLLGKLRHELAGRPAAGEQVWLTAGEVARRYGIRRGQATVWMNRLRELGKVRVNVPLAGKNDRGDTRYYLPDIEAAYTENAERVGRGESA